MHLKTAFAIKCVVTRVDKQGRGVTLRAKDYTGKADFLLFVSRYSKQLHCSDRVLFLLFYVRESL
jgi:hypothetical protein